MNIAIVGATGNVGRKTLEVFDKKNFKFDNLYLVASEKSAGKKIFFRDKEYEIENLENYDSVSYTHLTLPTILLV